MIKTKALRKVITLLLGQTQGETYHKKAPDTAAYPYKTYELQTVNTGDLSRSDYDLCVDIWDRAKDPSRAEEIADQLTELFNANNAPGDDVLPTFFRDSFYPVEDPDKTLTHYQMHFTVQTYDR